MSDDGAPGTTLALRSTNNQINPPGVAHNSHNSPASHHQSPAKLDQTQEMCPAWLGRADCVTGEESLLTSFTAIVFL